MPGGSSGSVQFRHREERRDARWIHGQSLDGPPRVILHRIEHLQRRGAPAVIDVRQVAERRKAKLTVHVEAGRGGESLRGLPLLVAGDEGIGPGTHRGDAVGRPGRAASKVIGQAGAGHAIQRIPDERAASPVQDRDGDVAFAEVAGHDRVADLVSGCGRIGTPRRDPHPDQWLQRGMAGRGAFGRRPAPHARRRGVGGCRGGEDERGCFETKWSGVKAKHAGTVGTRTGGSSDAVRIRGNQFLRGDTPGNPAGVDLIARRGRCLTGTGSRSTEWAMGDSNPRPHGCDPCALAS